MKRAVIWIAFLITWALLGAQHRQLRTMAAANELLIRAVLEDEEMIRDLRHGCRGTGSGNVATPRT